MQKTTQKIDKLIDKLEANVGGQTTLQPVKKQQVAQVQQVKKEQVQKQQVNQQKKQQEGQKKKEKKQKPKKEKKQQPKNQEPAEFGPKDFAMVDMRIGQIVQAWKHPQSENLYCEKISVCGQVRQIASGLQKFVPMDQMKGKVIVMCNLKPRPLAGFNSNGMVVCQSNGDHTQVNILRPQGEIGQRIVLQGFEQFFDSKQILPVLNPKKKILQKALQHFKTDDEGYVVWKGIKCRTKAGPIKGSIAKGNVS